MRLAPPARHPDSLGPLTLTADLRFSPEQFAAVCIAYPKAALGLIPDDHQAQLGYRLNP